MKKTQDPEFRYRRSQPKTPSQKKIDKIKNKSIEQFNVGLSYFRFFGTIWGLKNILPYVSIVLRKFFFVQYLQKMHLINFPVKHVDHALDEKVPFRTDKLPCYLDFISYWIRPMSMILKRYGFHEGMKLDCEYVNYISYIYDEAYHMYSTTLTTTYRPKSSLASIKSLQFWDPHYLCVPSLHVAIVMLTIGFYRMLFEREMFSPEEKDKWNKEIFDHGIEIIETVLYVKQHSVNCIPAAMYMMSRKCPELVDARLSHEVINALFVNTPDVEKTDGEKIRSHICAFYDKFMKESESEDDWITPIMNWLETYEPNTPSWANNN